MTSKTSGNGSAYRLIGEPGNQPVIVLIHGVGLNKEMWEPWIPVLEKEYSILTLDLYGHGESVNPEGSRSVRDFVGQVIGLVDELEIESFSLAGFSLGAIISQGCAYLHPNRLDSLVLLHSVYQRTEQQCQSVRERYQITLDQGVMATVELAIERWYTESYRLTHPEEMDKIREIFSHHVHDGYPKAYYLFGHAEPEMQGYTLDGFDKPALVVTGSDDVGSTPAMSQALARDLPNSELIINPGHRHMGPAEFAEVVANQVLSFLMKNQKN